VKSTADTVKLVFSLKSMIELLEYQVEIFSLGTTSGLIGEHLSEVLTSKSYKTSSKVALLLIDRTLDLVSPMLHSDHIMEKIEFTKPEILYKPVFKRSKELLSWIRQELIKKQNDEFELTSLTGLSHEKQIEHLIRNSSPYVDQDLIHFATDVLYALENLPDTDYYKWMEIEKMCLNSSDLKDIPKEYIKPLSYLLASLYPELETNIKSEKIENIKKLRKKYEKFKTLYQKDTFCGILKQITTSIMNNEDLVDFKKTKSLFTTLTTSFFSGFTKKVTIPEDCESIILFVVGGVSYQECQEVFDNSDSRFIIGSTCFTNMTKLKRYL
jgi:hypothetical protein